MTTGSHPMHTRAPLPPGPQPGGPASRHYRVFISYSHADRRWADWLIRRLEGYRVPARFHGLAAPIGTVGPRLAPVFRDRDELPTTSDLGETIRAALRESATLVAICSPAAAQSRWVREEIVNFKRLHGPAGVLAFIVAGEPKHEGGPDDCFSPALRRALGSDGELSASPAEVVAADARPHGDGREDAFLRLVAGLLGVGFDDLRRREQARRLRRMTLVAAGSAAGMAVTLGLAALAWQASNDAQRRQAQAEDLLGYMLVDFRLQLEKAGKLEFLSGVGEKAMTYVASLNSRDLTVGTLTNKARALTVIGIVQSQKLQAAAAIRTLSEAQALAAAIVQRHPAEAGVLFDRAQAEFWIGNAHYTRGEIGPAREWFVRYRDSGVALAGLDPANPRWQREAISGHHNLAAIEFERGNLAAARSGFLGELTVLEKLSAANPKNLDLRSSRANIISFVGTIAERSGDFAEALARFDRQSAILEELVKIEPGTAKLQERLANGCALKAGVLAATGQRDAALALRTRARRLLAPLIAADPGNLTYQRAAVKLRLQIAMLARARGDATAAQRAVEAIREELEALARAAPIDRRTAALRAATGRLRAELAADAQRPDAAAAAAEAVAMTESLLSQARPDDELTGDFLGACVVAGRIARARGENEAAMQHWQRAADHIGARLSATSNWRLLDPAARALAGLGRGAEGRALVERLTQLGYRPFEPWPDALPPASTDAGPKPPSKEQAHSPTTHSVGNQEPPTKEEMPCPPPVP